MPLRNHLDKSESESARGAVTLKVLTSRGCEERGEGRSGGVGEGRSGGEEEEWRRGGGVGERRRG